MRVPVANSTTWLREKVLAEGKVHAKELELIRVVDEPEEAVKIITKAHAEADFVAPCPRNRRQLISLSGFLAKLANARKKDRDGQLRLIRGVP